MRPRDIALVLIVIVIWGVNFVFIRWGVDEIPPLLLSALRYVAAVIPAILFVPRPKVRLSLLVGYGFAVGVLQFSLLFSAIKLGMLAGLSSLVMQLQAFFTIGLAMLILGERPQPLQLGGALIAFAGIGAIAIERFSVTALIPLLMTIGAALSWGLANVLTKRAGKIDMLGFVIWSSLVPPLPLYGLSLLIEGPGAAGVLAHVSPLAIVSVLFIGWASTVFGYGLWSIMLGRYPASTVAPFTLLVPVSGIGAAALILGERITGLEWIGSALVFAGLVVNVLAARFRRAPAADPAG